MKNVDFKEGNTRKIEELTWNFEKERLKIHYKENTKIL